MDSIIFKAKISNNLTVLQWTAGSLNLGASIHIRKKADYMN